VKPDVVAPGVNVLSSIPHGFCDAPPCFAFFQGTSMATPHLAGSAAVVKSQHATWSAAQIRSAIVNTAQRTVLLASNGLSPARDPNIIGAGRENLANAVAARVALDPVSISFGSVPSGSSQTRDFTLTLTNLSASAATYSIAVTGSDASVTFSAPTSASAAAGGSTTITVTMAANRGAAGGDHQGWLTVTNGGSEIAHALVYVFVK